MIKKKQIAALVLAGTMAMGSSMQAFACMGVYVGKEVSENGSSYIGRSEDIGVGHTKIFTVHPAEDHEPGAIFEDAYGFSMPYPEHTYQYTLAKDSPLFGEGEEPYAEVGINENEVAMTATVSTYYNDKAKAADPLVDTGICELSMGSILLGQAKTARDGVELLGESLSIEPSEAGVYGPYDLLFTPDKKFSTQDIMKFLAYRGEGTKMDSNVNESIYAIGNKNQAECHILEMRDGMYQGMSGVEWLAMSRAEFSLYLPYYGAMLTETWDGYHNDELTSVEDSMFWVFNDLNDLADDNRELYGTNIRKYWDAYQAELIEQQKQVDVDMQKLYEKSPELAQEKATEIGKVIAQDAFNSAKSILTELKAFKESGSTEMFVPSVLTENIMPNYTVARVMDEVSTEALEALIAKAEAVQKDMYTEASYATLEKELENAKTVLADEFAVQDEIDAATKQLDSALQGLEKIQAAVPQSEKEPVSEEKTTPTQPSPKTVDATPLMWLLAVAAGSSLVSVHVWKRREEK